MNLSLREKLDAGHPVLGTFVKLHVPAVVELAALGGLDFVVIDREHGNFTDGQVENLIRAAEAMDISALVRTPDASEAAILHALDSGATGVQIPSLDNPAQAVVAAQYARHAPYGRRGFARVNRSAGYGTLPLEQYLEQARQVIVSVHVENQAMVDSVDRLCSVPGLDMLFLGTADLSQSLGVTGSLAHPQVLEAVDRVIAAAREHCLHIGAAASNAEEVTSLIARGVRCIIWQSDIALLRQGFAQVSAAFLSHRNNQQ